MMTKSFTFIFTKAATMLLLVLLTSVSAWADEPGHTIVVIADPHVMGEGLQDGGTAWQNYLAGSRKLIDKSKALFDRAVENIKSQKPELVLIVGDLTKDGEQASHDCVKEKLDELKAGSIPTLVIPGNHDLGTADAKIYSGDATSPAPRIAGASAFAKLYADYGYGASSERLGTTLTYACEPIAGLVVIGIDSGTNGVLSNATVNWVCAKASAAHAAGKQVIAMMHHPLIPHITGGDTFVDNVSVSNYENVRNSFADAGIRTIFTGHFHTSDIAKDWNFDKSKTIYDINTGSLCSYPCDYRVVTLNSDMTTMSISTSTATGDATISESDAKDRLTTVMTNIVKPKITAKAIENGINEPLATIAANTLTPKMVNAYIYHAEGDEHDNTDAKNLLEELKTRFASYPTYLAMLNSMLQDKSNYGTDREDQTNDRDLNVTMPTWNGETFTVTSTKQITGLIYVNDDATLTINSGQTVTVSGGIVIAQYKTLTVTGGGTLVVNGSNGSNGSTGGDAIQGDVIINGANVTAKGGQGGKGSDGSNGVTGSDGTGGTSGGNGTQGGNGGTGGKGGAAFTGQVTIFSGTITANGGQGGQGGKGGTGGTGGTSNGYDQYGYVGSGGSGGTGGHGGLGGNGGDAFSGTINIYGGTITATGGKGGLGGNGGTGGTGGQCYAQQGYGGNGGNGGDGGNCGNGGYAFSGNLSFYGGTITATGGQGGSYPPINQSIGGKNRLSYQGNGGQGGIGGQGTHSGTSGNKGNNGSNGNPANAFANDVTFNAASYTLKGGATANPSEVVASATGYQYVTITADNASVPVVASGSCGVLSWSLNFLGVLTISGNGDMPNNFGEADDQPWKYYRSKIKSIVIEEGVTSIGQYAFSMCEKVTSVSIAASVTSIGNYSFNYCGMPSVTFEGNSALTTIANNAFYTSGITTITIPAGVTSIGSYAFDCSTNLGAVTLNSNPTIGSSAFADAIVTMNLTGNEGATGEFWTTFYNETCNFQVPEEGTQIFKAALTGTALALTELTTDQIVTKNNAVILKSTASPIVLTLTKTDSNNSFAGNSLKGVKDAAGLVAENPSTTYVLNKGSKGVGFYKLTAGKKVGVGKAYLTSPASAPSFFAFDETTSIAEVRSKMSDIRGGYYDLQGRRVAQPTKGLYIINGKKVVIK